MGCPDGLAAGSCGVQAQASSRFLRASFSVLHHKPEVGATEAPGTAGKTVVTESSAGLRPHVGGCPAPRTAGRWAREVGGRPLLLALGCELEACSQGGSPARGAPSSDQSSKRVGADCPAAGLSEISCKELHTQLLPFLGPAHAALAPIPSRGSWAAHLESAAFRF